MKLPLAILGWISFVLCFSIMLHIGEFVFEFEKFIYISTWGVACFFASSFSEHFVRGFFGRLLRGNLPLKRKYITLGFDGDFFLDISDNVALRVLYLLKHYEDEATDELHKTLDKYLINKAQYKRFLKEQDR